MKNPFFKEIIAKFFTVALVIAIAIPSSILARPFASDPEIKVYPDNEVLTFADTKKGESRIEYFTIENTSDFSRLIQISRLPNEPFYYEGSRDLEITPRSTRSFPVIFSPNSNGNSQSTLNIVNTYTGESKTLTLKGNTPKEVNNKRLEVSKSNLNFPQTLIGESADTTITLKNENPFALELDLSISAPFSLRNGTPNLILPGEKIELTITFSPRESKQYNQSLTIRTNSPEDRNRNITVDLRGRGLDGFTEIKPELEIKSSNILDYGTVSTRSTNHKYIEVKNNGNRSLNLRLQRTNSSEFQIDFGNGQTETTVLANQTKKIRVIFNPNSTGSFQTEFRLETNSSNLPYATFLARGQANQNGTNNSNQSTTYHNYNLTVSRTTINPDLNEITYFNITSPTNTTAQLEIIDTKNNQIIYSKNSTIQKGINNWQVSWNGRNFAGNKVSNGNYKFNLKTSHGQNSGIIKVVRNQNHNSEDYILYFDQNPFYEQYTRNNETLINGLFVGPSILVAHEAYVYTSFMLEHNAPVTANILDGQKRLIKTVKKNMPTSAGYKRNYIEWNTKINGQPAPDGQYYFEITAARAGESDSDIVPFFIDRGPYFPELFQQPQQEGPMGPVNNFYYQYNRPTRPTQPTTTPNATCLDFIDVEANTEFCNAVILSAQEQLFTGSLNEAGLQTLRADDFVTKAEATAIIVRLLGIKPSDYNPNLDGNLGFKDLDPTQWYMPYFKTISQLAIRQTQNPTSQDWIKTILKAYPDGTIRPTQPITRIQFYKLSLEAIKQSKNIKSNFSLNYQPKNSAFSDTKFSKANLRYLPYSNFIQTKLGKSNFGQKYFAQNKFKPNQALTRAEVIEFIYQLQISQNIQF